MPNRASLTDFADRSLFPMEPEAESLPADPESGPDPSQQPRKGPIRDAILVTGLLVAVFFGGSIWINRGNHRDPAAATKRIYAQYVGEPSCRECHPGITALHARSGHSRTLRMAGEIPLAPLMNGRTGKDPEYPGAEFSYQFKDGQLTTTRNPHESGPVERLLQYAVGSGQHATTFVTLNDGSSELAGAIEHRLTHFTEQGPGRLGITPGQESTTTVNRAVKTPDGRQLTPAETRKCFDCHATVLSDRGAIALDRSTLIPTVSCERCHGPGKAHVEAARRGETLLAMPFGVGRESADLEIRLCGHCHRLPEMAPPGSIRTDNIELARFQPVSLMQSACYKGSKDVMRCTTCHDPHSRSSTDIPTYEKTCLKCHSAQAQKKCSVKPLPANGCVGCHMPKRDAGQGILFTDHWIRIHPEKGP